MSIRGFPVRALLAGSIWAETGARLGAWPARATWCLEALVDDIVFVIVTVVFFAVAALIVKGVERL
jgi:hypothetical protein